MCWDAVAHVAMLAGVISESRYAALKGEQRIDNHVLVKTSDPQVNGAAGAKSVPAGHAVCFFSGAGSKAMMIHAMLSVGNGKAAGNKNGCIGIGKDLGWEVIDITKANWSGNVIKRGGEEIHVHHRPITQLA